MDDMIENQDTDTATFDMGAAVDSISSDLFQSKKDDPETNADLASRDDNETPTNTQDDLAEAPAVKQPPQSWPKEKHGIWGTLTPEAQEFYELRERQMLDGIEQYKGDAGYGKAMRDVFTPFKDAYQGAPEPQVFQFLLNANHVLTRGTPEQREAAYRSLGRNLGLVKDGATRDAAEDANVTPELKKLRDEVYAIRSDAAARAERERIQENDRVGLHVNAFADEKDENGNQKHPYFDEVSNDIIRLIAGARAMGQQPELSQIYEAAVYANPVTRAKENARLLEGHEKKLRENARLDALKASKAKGANVRSRETTKAPTEPLGTMDDTMKATLADIQSRTH